MTCKHQIPDSFPYVIERDFGEDMALEFEQYVANTDASSIENVEKNINFGVGVDHMNQVISFERIIYFGYIQEHKKDPKLQLNENYGKKEKFMKNIAFGTKVKEPTVFPKMTGKGNNESPPPERAGSDYRTSPQKSHMNQDLSLEIDNPPHDTSYNDNFSQVQSTIKKL